MTHLFKTLAVVAASLLAAQSFAQTPAEVAAAQARYKQDVKDCGVSHPVVGKDTCLKEAKNALADFKRGRMNESFRSSDYERNALQRCDVHKGEDRADCDARIRGLGRIEGSVAGGGILRELTTRTVVRSPVAPMQAQPATDVDEPRPSGLMSNCRWVPPTDWVCK